MTVTTDWTPLAPGGSDNPKQGDDEIRTMKSAIQERMRNGGHVWTTVSTGAANTDDGKIACGIQGTNTLTFYETDGTTPVVTVNDSSKSITLGDGTTGSNRYALIVGGTLTHRGAVVHGIATTSASTYTVATTDHTVFCTRNGTVAVTLPAASAIAGRIVHVKRTASLAATNTITLTPGAGDTIDNATNYVFANSTTIYQAVRVQCDGATNWFVVGGYWS